MTEAEYRKAEGISRSELWRIRESPEKFKYYQEHPEVPTPALIFGAAAHKMLLEPDRWGEDYVVAPTADRRTKEGKALHAAFLEALGSREPINQDDYDQILQMVEAARSVGFVSRLLEGEKEMPIFWTDELTGEACKVRLDCLTEVAGQPVIVDYKTTGNAATDAFMRSAVNYGYDFQAAMYSEAVKAMTGKDPLFVFIAQEKTAPYAVNVLQADEVFLRRGRDIFRELLGTYHDCRTTGNWWGYLGPHNVINNLALPAWLAREVE